MTLRCCEWLVCGLLLCAEGCGGRVSGDPESFEETPAAGSGAFPGGGGVAAVGGRPVARGGASAASGGSGGAPVPSGGAGAGVGGTGAMPAIGGSPGGGALGGTSGAPGGSGGAVAGTGGAFDCGALIDDLERGTGRICEDGRRKGVWYALHDGFDDLFPLPTPPGVPYPPTRLAEARGASRWAMMTQVTCRPDTCSFVNAYRAWGNGLGLDLAYDGRSYGQYDATAYDGVRFWIRSDPALSVEFRVSSLLTTLVEYGGLCPREFCDPHHTSVSATPEWTEHTVLFADLMQEGWWGECCSNPSPVGPLPRGALTNIQFLVRKPSASYELWVDDVEFVVAPPGRP